MPAPAWENLDVFMAPDTAGGFAVPAVVSLRGGGTRKIFGIFDDPYLQATAGEFVRDTAETTLLCKEGDLAGVDYKGTCEVFGVTYDIVTNPQSDGTGMSTLKLAKQAGL
jgi:hypothetical protein